MKATTLPDRRRHLLAPIASLFFNSAASRRRRRFPRRRRLHKATPWSAVAFPSVARCCCCWKTCSSFTEFRLPSFAQLLLNPLSFPTGLIGFSMRFTGFYWVFPCVLLKLSAFTEFWFYGYLVSVVAGGSNELSSRFLLGFPSGLLGFP